MKAIFVVPSIHGGGAERVISLLSSDWANRGYEVHVIATSFSDNTKYNLDEKVDVRFLCKNHNLSILSKVKIIRKMFKQIKPDIAISFMPNSDFLVLVSSLGLKIKRICSERNSPQDYPTSLSLRLLRKFCFRLAHKIVFQTKEAMNYFSQSIQKKGIVINNPVCIGNINKPSLTNCQNRIIAVGRLYEQKNFDLLIDAYYLYHSQGGSYCLCLFGDGVLKEHLEQKIHSLNLNEFVSIQSFSKNIWSEIANSKVFCLTSKFEGIPNVLLEAEAIGTPVVSTNCRPGGAKLLIKNGYNGLLVENDNPQSFANALLKMDSKIDFFSKNALEYKRLINEKYSLTNISYQWLQLIEQIVKEEN